MVVDNQLLWVIQRKKKHFSLGSQRKVKANSLKIEAKLFHVYLHFLKYICISYLFLPS